MTLHRFTFRAMAAENEVQLHCDDVAQAEAAAARAIAEVQRIEAKYSRYLATSVVSRINAQAGGAPVAVDAETGGLLAFAAACHEQSDGAFDATSGVLRRAWRFDATPACAQCVNRQIESPDFAPGPSVQSGPSGHIRLRRYQSTLGAQSSSCRRYTCCY